MRTPARTLQFVILGNWLIIALWSHCLHKRSGIVRFRAAARCLADVCCEGGRLRMKLTFAPLETLTWLRLASSDQRLTSAKANRSRSFPKILHLLEP